MSDADDQLGGTGGPRGKEPSEDLDEEEHQESKTTGKGQAAVNREDDPPA